MPLVAVDRLVRHRPKAAVSSCAAFLLRWHFLQRSILVSTLPSQPREKRHIIAALKNPAALLSSFRCHMVWRLLLKASFQWLYLNFASFQMQFLHVCLQWWLVMNCFPDPACYAPVTLSLQHLPGHLELVRSPWNQKPFIWGRKKPHKTKTAKNPTKTPHFVTWWSSEVKNTWSLIPVYSFACWARWHEADHSAKLHRKPGLLV